MASRHRELSFESKPQTEIVRTRRRNQVAAATAILNKSLFVGGLITALNAFSVFSAESAGSSLNFAGVAFSPGSTVQANVPLSAQEKSLAAQEAMQCRRTQSLCWRRLRISIRERVGQFWCLVPPAISNVRIEMILSSFIAGSD